MNHRDYDAIPLSAIILGTIVSIAIFLTAIMNGDFSTESFLAGGMVAAAFFLMIPILYPLVAFAIKASLLASVALAMLVSMLFHDLQRRTRVKVATSSK